MHVFHGACLKRSFYHWMTTNDVHVDNLKSWKNHVCLNCRRSVDAIQTLNIFPFGPEEEADLDRKDLVAEAYLNLGVEFQRHQAKGRDPRRKPQHHDPYGMVKRNHVSTEEHRYLRLQYHLPADDTHVFDYIIVASVENTMGEVASCWLRYFHRYNKNIVIGGRPRFLEVGGSQCAWSLTVRRA